MAYENREEEKWHGRLSESGSYALYIANGRESFRDRVRLNDRLSNIYYLTFNNQE